MKQLILTICFSIILFGNPSEVQLQIAEKYNWIRQDIRVEIRNELTSTGKCKDAIGCTYWIDNKPTRIEIKSDTKYFERVLIHEVVHYIFDIKDEDIVWDITTRIIRWVNKY